MSTVIEARGIGKRYVIGGSARHNTLRDSLGALAAFRRRTATRELWALKQVSFDIAEGELVAIIGRNGSGKSTLLKVLSRITEPTEGHALVTGRVGSLLEVGTGFHPELTGRENVFVNGAILGMRRREIAAKFDEIVAFAEVESFIDTPVKHYSSGMQMRLAFAVAAHLEPTILLVDEVLAVGDAAFQRKCVGKMGDVAREGRTVLFVSHDLTSVQVLCRRAIRLAHGTVVGIGEVGDEIRAYLTDARVHAPTELDHPRPLDAHWSLVRFGFDPNPVASGSPTSFHLELQTTRPARFDEVAILVHDALGRRVGVIDFRQPSMQHETSADGRLSLTAELSTMPLVEGEYRVGASIRAGDVHHIVYDLATVDVMARSNTSLVPYRADIRGVVAFDYRVVVS